LREPILTRPSPHPLDALRRSFPGGFAFVMATGIVSLALYAQGLAGGAHALFVVNAAAYGILWIAGASRMAHSARTLVRELCDHTRGPAFLTIVAGTCVLGVQCVELAEWHPVGAALWIASLLLWALLIYGFFAAVTLVEAKPTLEHGLDGSWLLATVSTEAIAVLGTLVAGDFQRRDVVTFVCLVFFLAGAMLYIVVIGLIFFRWIFRPMGPHMLTPTYWINMGAVAITTLAGAHLIAAAPAYAFVAGIQHFIEGFTLFFWATGTWWIPLLVAVFAWRHVHQRVPIRYDPQYWSLVFPLGMYSVATRAYAHDNGLAFLDPLARAAAYVAFVAWLLTAAGLVHRLLARRMEASASR
jgi:tellurite resistance protein TehA-like permease